MQEKTEDDLLEGEGEMTVTKKKPKKEKPVPIVDLFELPMVLEGKCNAYSDLVTACGYSFTEERIAEIDQFLKEKKIDMLTLDIMLQALNFSKMQDLQMEQESDMDEYLEAFVALGGEVTKQGVVSNDVLIQIIKMEFEMTLDMEDYLRKSGGDSDEIVYYQFCRLLDAGTGGNPSRISSFISQNKGSTSFMRFSFFNDNANRLSFFA